jgi:uncharacterized membrane protein
LEEAVNRKIDSRQVSLAVLIASLYAVLTVILGPFGYSWIQVRVSEALTPLPYLLGLPAVAGLTLGVVVANIFSPVGLPDMIFGPLLTLAAAVLSWKLNFDSGLVACIYPVVVNALGVSAYIAGFYGVRYELSVISIGVGEVISVVLLGYPLLRVLERTGWTTEQ